MHWAAKASLVKSHRKTAIILTPKEAGERKITDYQIHFTFPDNRRRDLDNFTGRCKAYLDGISDATQQDDSAWGMKAPTREVKKGINQVTITLFYS